MSTFSTSGPGPDRVVHTPQGMSKFSVSIKEEARVGVVRIGPSESQGSREWIPPCANCNWVATNSPFGRPEDIAADLLLRIRVRRPVGRPPLHVISSRGRLRGRGGTRGRGMGNTHMGIALLKLAITSDEMGRWAAVAWGE